MDQGRSRMIFSGQGGSYPGRSCKIGTYQHQRIYILFPLFPEFRSRGAFMGRGTGFSQVNDHDLSIHSDLRVQLRPIQPTTIPFAHKYTLLY